MRKMAMTFLAAIALMSSLATAENSVVIFGDSISAQRNSWPQFLRDDHGYHISLHAQSLRAAAHFDVPDDLAPLDFKRAIYFLGTNDAVFDELGLALFKREFNLHMVDLIARQLPVFVIVPASYEHELYSQGIGSVRDHILMMCANPIIECLDADTFWDVELTYDGVHPKPALSKIIAQKVAEAL